MQKKGINYFIISILVSNISIFITLFINHKIAEEYLKSNGKSRALFGIKELLQFNYQYYVVIPGIVSCILLILAIKIGIPTGKTITAALLSLLAITIVFVRIWRIFI